VHRPRATPGRDGLTIASGRIVEIDTIADLGGVERLAAPLLSSVRREQDASGSS
jgi:hypothetical protein